MNILSRLEKEYIQDEKFDLDIIRANLLALLLEVKKFSKQEKTTKILHSASRNNIKINLRAIFMKRSVADYASMLAVSPNHFK